MKNKIQDYHISKGADSHFYILNNGDFFVQNLSTDLDKAISKAKKITGKDVPVDIWLRTNKTTFFMNQNQNSIMHTLLHINLI